MDTTVADSSLSIEFVSKSISLYCELELSERILIISELSLCINSTNLSCFSCCCNNNFSDSMLAELISDKDLVIRPAAILISDTPLSVLSNFELIMFERTIEPNIPRIDVTKAVLRPSSKSGILESKSDVSKPTNPTVIPIKVNNTPNVDIDEGNWFINLLFSIRVLFPETLFIYKSNITKTSKINPIQINVNGEKELFISILCNFIIYF